MSHCPGYDLESLLTDCYGIAVKDYGDGWQAIYAGSKIMDKETLEEFVQIHEPMREQVEGYVEAFWEPDRMSWRDFSYSMWDVIFEDYPEVEKEADEFLGSREFETTDGAVG